MKATTTCLLVAVLAVGSIEITDARAQGQQGPPGYPQFPPPGQNGFPDFGGSQGGFPGFPQGGFPGIQQGGFPGSPQGGFPGSPQGGFLGIPGIPQNDAALEELKRTCLANGGPNAYKDVETAIQNVVVCVGQSLQNVATAGDPSLGGMCKSMESSILQCLNGVTSKLERCTDKTTKYLPDFVLDTVRSFFKFMCKDDAKIFATTMSQSIRSDPCIQKFSVAAQQCSSGTKHLKTEEGAGFRNVTKAQLCSDIAIVRDCTNKKAKEVCSGDTLEFITGITNAVHEPCSACKIFITNTFILFILLLLTKLF